uniref:Uncharacterized protein n=1 Tax=Aegilops tauschii subsp. strangulata TaxID=200361 RepID=A0A453GZV1_AEGTS
QLLSSLVFCCISKIHSSACLMISTFLCKLVLCGRARVNEMVCASPSYSRRLCHLLRTHRLCVRAGAGAEPKPGGEAGGVGKRRRGRPRHRRHRCGAAPAGEHRRPLGQGHRLRRLHLHRRGRAAAHRRALGRRRRCRGRHYHPGPL